METKYEIIFFENENGEKPAYEFILKADKKMKAKIFSNLYELEMHGHKLREPYSKHLTGGIFELRSRVGTNSARVLYFFHYGRRIILTNGFV